MNSASKATLLSATFLGSLLLYRVFLPKPTKRMTKKGAKLSKKELESQFRKQIKSITEHIELSQHNNQKTNNIMYNDKHFGKILQFLTTFEYINIICKLSKYHYLYLHHKGIKYQTNRNITNQMLFNESCLSWNIDKIERFFSKKELDIYHFMYYIANNWKFSGCSPTLKNDRSSEIIQQMICIPYHVPNINIIKHWFHYISFKLNIPINQICFKSHIDENVKHKKSLKYYFVSSDSVNNRYELHLFIWFIIYNLYQLYFEINKQTKSDKDNGKDNNVMHSNYFGLKHVLQKWMVNEHNFHFKNCDNIALLKLYRMIICGGLHGNKFNMIFIVCIMFKIIFHNTELHIVKMNKNKNKNKKKHKNEANQIRDIFLHNLNNIVIFTQYVVEMDVNHYDNSELKENFKYFKLLLRNFKITDMVKNILSWFAKLNNKRVFYVCKGNAFSIDVTSPYFALFGLKSKFYPLDSVLYDQIAIWVQTDN